MSQGILLGGSGGYGTLPEQATSFYATNDDAKVELTWQNPSDDSFSGVLIVRRTEDYPKRPSDGVKIYKGTGTSCIDTGLINGTQYYYRAFAYNSRGEYQTIFCVATAVPRAGILASALPTGAKIKLGMYYGKPIVWNVIDKNHSGYPANSVTLMSDRILTLKCFDAKEPTNSDSNRHNYGNNRYAVSNIRQWLNSDANAGKWYSAQHPYDAPPNSDNVWSNYNEYDAEAGFLNDFSANAKNALLNTTLTTVLNTITDAENIGAYEENIADKIFLASRTEMGFGNESNIAEGTPFSVFDSDASRDSLRTDECINHSEYLGVLGYWLRTPTLLGTSQMYSVRTNWNPSSDNGTLSGSDSYCGNTGIRPLCNISGSTIISAEPDTDGCYTLREV